MRSVVIWVTWVAASFACAIPGMSSPPGEWYDSLAKPDWTPAGWVFPVVWTTLYLSMGTSAWLVSMRHSERRDVRLPLTLFGIQLAFNAAWSPTFFGQQRMFPALILIVALWFAIVLTMIQFRRISSLAFFLMVPYIAWISLATALNFEIWRLNS